MFAYWSKTRKRVELGAAAGVQQVVRDGERGAYVVPQSREPTKSPCLSPDMLEAEVGVG